MKLDGPLEHVLREKGKDVFTVGADATVYEALVIMAEKRIGALPVVDGEKLVGIFSERDYARKVILAGRASRQMKVREIMSEEVTTVTGKTTIGQCMQYMTRRRCRHLPVLEDGKMVALVSLGDLVHWIIQAQDQTIEDLEHYISGDYPG